MASENARPTSARQAALAPDAKPHHITADTPYESALKPALWLLVPFILTLLYGYYY